MHEDNNTTNKDNSLKIFIGMMLFVALMAFAKWHDNPDNRNPKLNIQHFKNNKSLICQNSLGGGSAILINKKDGWELYKKQYFKKGEELLNIEYCTQVEEEEQ